MFKRIIFILICCIFCYIPVSASTPLRREISNEKPLFIYNISLNQDEQNDKDDIHMHNFWLILPDDVKQYFAVQLIPNIKDNNSLQNTKSIQKMLDKAQENKIPIILQIETTDTRNQIKQTYYDELFKKYSCLIGLSIQGLSASGSTITALDQNYINTIKKTIDTVSNNGGIFFWQEMAYKTKHVFAKASADKDLYNKIKDNKQNIVLIKDNKGNDKRFAGTSLVMGYWVSNSINNWGINSNDSIWWEAGFGHLYSPIKEKKEHEFWKSRFTFPDSQFGVEWMIALTGGATVYSLDSPLHGYASKDGREFTPAFKNVLLPLIRQIINYKLIPSKHEVINKTKVVFQPNQEDSQVLVGDRLFKDLYGPNINNLFEWMPCTGRYYFIPTLPVLNNEKINNRFEYTIQEQFYNKYLSNNNKEKVKFFNNIYKMNGYGDSWFVNINNSWFITNPNENKDLETYFNIPLKTNTCTSLEGKIKPHTFIITREKEDGLNVYLNNYRINSDKDVWRNYNLSCENPESYTKYNYIPNPTEGELRKSELVINGVTDGKPKFNIDGKERYKYTTEWNEELKRFKIVIEHNGEISIDIKATGIIEDNLEKNIAPYGKILSSSEEETNSTKFIIDGNCNTKWSSSTQDKAGSWIQLDLLHEVTIDSMIINEYLDRVTNFKIQYDNKKGWKDLLEGKKIGIEKKLIFDPVTTNKIRIIFTGTKTDSEGLGSQPSIYEWKVFTREDIFFNNEPKENIAIGQKCIISSDEKDNKQDTNRIIDDNFSTYCNINRKDGEQWIEINFNEPVTFNKVMIYEYFDRINDYYFKYWKDNRWIFIKQSQSNGNNITDFTVPIKTDRLRIYIDSCKLDSYKKGRIPIISEVKIFNE